MAFLDETSGGYSKQCTRVKPAARRERPTIRPMSLKDVTDFTR